MIAPLFLVRVSRWVDRTGVTAEVFSAQRYLFPRWEWASGPHSSHANLIAHLRYLQSL